MTAQIADWMDLSLMAFPSKFEGLVLADGAITHKLHDFKLRRIAELGLHLFLKM